MNFLQKYCIDVINFFCLFVDEETFLDFSIHLLVRQKRKYNILDHELISTRFVCKVSDLTKKEDIFLYYIHFSQRSSHLFNHPNSTWRLPQNSCLRRWWVIRRKYFRHGNQIFSSANVTVSLQFQLVNLWCVVFSCNGFSFLKIIN